MMVSNISESPFSRWPPFVLSNQFIPGGGFNPFKKYARQIGFIFPNFRGEHKKLLKPPPRKLTARP